MIYDNFLAFVSLNQYEVKTKINQLAQPLDFLSRSDQYQTLIIQLHSHAAALQIAANATFYVSCLGLALGVHPEGARAPGSAYCLAQVYLSRCLIAGYVLLGWELLLVR